MPRNPMLVLNAGAYTGSAIAKAFHAIEADEGWEVTGTLKANSQKPKWVSEVVDGADAEALGAAIARSRIIVLDLVADIDGAEKVLELLAEHAGEEEKIVIGVSTIMTWSRTSPADPEDLEKALTDEEYKRRRPHVNFRDQHTLEKLVVRSKSATVRTVVVAAGLLYGGGEDIFHELFKLAWHNKSVPLLSFDEGANIVPTMHITDLCSVVTELGAGNIPASYVVAVDQAQGQTLKAITQAIATVLGTGEIDRPIKEDVALNRHADYFQVDLKIQAALVADMGIEWVAQAGLVRSMPKVVAEYRKERGIEPLKLLVVGPLAGVEGCTEFALAAALAAEYKVPHITAAALVAEVLAGESELKDRVKAAKDKEKKGAAPGDLPDDLMKDVLIAKLNTPACTNQGWILDGVPATLPLLKLVAPEKDDDEEEEEAAEEEEGEEGAVPPKPASELTPEHVIVVRAPDNVLKQRAQALSQAQVEASGMTQDALHKRAQVFAQANQPEGPNNVLSHKALQNIEALELDDDGGDQHAAPLEGFLVKSRIYLGKARNYGPTPAEVQAKADRLAAVAAAEAAAAEEEAAARLAAEKEERERLRADEAARHGELEAQEREVLEARSVPLRSYLMAEVIPTLTEGLIEVTKVRPEDPVDYLAEWLFKNNPVLE